MAENRKPRAQETREQEARPIPEWAPATSLPTPEAQDGYHFRWVRTSMMDRADNKNVSRRFREGYEPVKREDHPEFEDLMSDTGSRWADRGAIEVGGLLLCKISSEKVEAREKYFQQLSDAQIEAVDNQLMGAQDARLPTIMRPERRSTTSFGDGGS